MGPGDPLAAPGPAGGPAEVDPLIVGDRLLVAGEPEMAREAFLRAATRDGLTPRVRLGLAAADAGQGRLLQAERLLRGVVAERPRDADAMNDLAVVLLRLDRPGEAYRMLRTAFALQPSPEIRNNLRASAARLGDPSYADEPDAGFTLTRGADGAIGLHPPAEP
jgi:Flp pilus assembly protein TadD